MNRLRPRPLGKKFKVPPPHKNAKLPKRHRRSKVGAFDPPPLSCPCAEKYEFGWMVDKPVGDWAERRERKGEAINKIKRQIKRK